MNNPTTAQSAICATCRRRLIPTDQLDDAGRRIGTTFEHQLVAVGEVPCSNLVVIPVESAAAHPDQVSVCDFCGGTGVAWRYPADDFPTPGDPELVMTGEWMACYPCHADIQAKSWDRMAERQGRVHGFFMTRQARTHFVGIFRAFDMHRTGEPTPL